MTVKEVREFIAAYKDEDEVLIVPAHQLSVRVKEAPAEAAPVAEVKA